jgi:hypothetical protein
VPDAPFPPPADLPDVERIGTLARDMRPASLSMDHLTFALFDVPDTDGPIRLAAFFPEGTSAALALVARTGSAASGDVTAELVHLRDGGAGRVTIRRPGDFYGSGGRITAVLVNADAAHGPLWDDRTGDWPWSRDGQPVTVRLSSDTRAPRASLRGLRLRSRDRDPLTFEATLRQGGRVVGERSGRLRARGKRRLRFRGADAGRARLVVELSDPSANRKRLAQTLRLGA